MTLSMAGIQTDGVIAATRTPDQWGPKAAPATLGLVYAYYGGPKIDGTMAADGTLALTDNALNYVERTYAGVVSVNQTGFTPSSIAMAEITTLAGIITAFADWRPHHGPFPYFPVTTAELALVAPNTLPVSVAYRWGDLRRFGALGNGVHDDTVAFNSALASGAGQVTSWPGANHLTTALMPVKVSGTRLTGYGATITPSGSLTSIFHVGNNGAGVFVKTDDVTIEDWVFVGAADGTGSPGSPPFAIGVMPPTVVPYVEGAGCSRITVRNCRQSGFCFGLTATGADTIRIEDFTVGGNFYYAGLAAGGYGVLLQTCFRVSIVRLRGTATVHDRHAIYVSSDPGRAFDNNNVCKNIQIIDPDLDWTGVLGAPTKLEAIMAIRAPENCTVSGGILRGGYGGIDYDGQNGNGRNFVVRGVTFDGTFAGTSERGCIDIIRSAGTYILDGLEITGNTFRPSGANMHGVTLLACKNFNVSGNVGVITASISLVQVAGLVTDGYLGGNTWNNTSQFTYQFNGAGNANITIGKDRGSLSGGGVMYTFVTTPTGLQFAFPRSAQVLANSTVTPTIGTDTFGIVASVASDANGIAVTFASWVDTPTQLKIFGFSCGSSIGNVYVRSIAGQVVTFGVLSTAGAALPAATNTYTLTLQATE